MVVCTADSATSSSSEHASVLTAQAVCCALLFLSASEDDIEEYLAEVQRQLEAADQAETAQDVAYSSKLAAHIQKASMLPAEHRPCCLLRCDSSLA